MKTNLIKVLEWHILTHSFTKICVCVCARAHTRTPVSYTHLDVYKRQGPYWLSKEPSSWPTSPFESNSSCTHPDLDKEKRKQGQLALVTTSSTPNYIENYSSLSRLIRVFAYCLRFIRNAKSPVANRNTSFLTSQELRSTLLIFIRQSQLSHFNIEIKELQAQRPLSLIHI